MLFTDAANPWRGGLVFCAAARRLCARDQWIGWSEGQRCRRLPLVVNNCRFLLRPDKTFANLGARSLRRTLARLSADWQTRYGHPVVLVETFVDPAQFCGTVYSASGWHELGRTDGFGRVRRDFYVQHHQPKRLFARELCEPLELEGRKVSLDALHTQDPTARERGLAHGADFLLTVKDKQPTVRANIERLVAAPPARSSPPARERVTSGIHSPVERLLSRAEGHHAGPGRQP